MAHIFIERPFVRRNEIAKAAQWIKGRVPSKEYHIKIGHTPESDDDEDQDLDIETVTADITVWSEDADLVIFELCLRI